MPAYDNETFDHLLSVVDVERKMASVLAFSRERRRRTSPHASGL
jgi:hypothetical protein